MKINKSLEELNYLECLLFIDENSLNPKELLRLAEAVDNSTKMNYREISKIQSKARNRAWDLLDRDFPERPN